jgi:hypothetical protein
LLRFEFSNGGVFGVKEFRTNDSIELHHVILASELERANKLCYIHSCINA